MKRILLLGNRKRPEVSRECERALPRLRQLGEVVEVDLSQPETTVTDADFAIVIGGDGSILRAARALAPRGIPAVGVNVGKLGFLAELRPDELADAVDLIEAGEHEIAPRMMIHCVASRAGRTLLETPALNDVVISRGSLSRLVSIGLYINGEHVTDYNGDGLIVSTPVGSTAHSLAAGGPILEADLRAFVITPICPHTLTNRPLVIPAASTVEMVVNRSRLPTALTADGQVYTELRPGDRVVVTMAEQDFKLIRTGTRSYYRTLREKLGWGGHPNYGDRENP